MKTKIRNIEKAVLASLPLPGSMVLYIMDIVSMFGTIKYLTVFF